MKTFILIIIAIATIILLFLYFKGIYNKSLLIKEFNRCNVIVAGKQGTGKDILFQTVIHAKKKEKAFTNIDYGYNTEHVEISQLSVAPNTYENFINGNIKKIPRNEEMEGKDVYISDAGIHLPSQYDSKLHKQYPSFPIYYALTRQLYDQHIHMNAQTFDRIWKVIREQGDYYIVCKRTIKLLGFIFIVRYITYEKYESAKANILPMKNRLFNKFSKAEQDQFNATNGEIKKRYIITYKWRIKYDTRAFKKVLFDLKDA